MEWVIGVGSVLVSVGVSVWIARWSDNRQEDRHKTQLDSAERRFEEELAEARRQWNETAGSIHIDVDYRPHAQERRRDVVEIIVTNPGRMPVFVRDVTVSDDAGIAMVPLRPPDGYPVRIEPNEPLSLEAPRGALEDNGRKSHNPERWFDEMAVWVTTGDGRFFKWDPHNRTTEGTRR